MPTLPDQLSINTRFQLALEELEWSYARSSGPGGQNVNKVNSKVQLTWKPEESNSIPDDLRLRLLTRLEPHLTVDREIRIDSQLFRDQPRNREDCLEKLKALLLAALVVPKVRKKTKPSRASQTRRLNEKKRESTRKQDRRPPRNDE
ncbi:MAG: aminoacyl-tRNA hydrolase [Planctomycetota bacterium]|nr:MAG: aminoacyl-tRNA hydrolase [Planctomycetota bacterium]